MTFSASNNTDDLPDALLEEAAIWHARMREPEEDVSRAAEKQRQFENWLAADPRHPEALNEIGHLWDALEWPIERTLAEKSWQQHRTTGLERLGSALAWLGRPWRIGLVPLPRGAALAACLLVLLLGGTVWRDDITIAMTSDYSTAVGERSPVMLADGSQIILNTDSAIAIDLSPAARHVRLLKGEAWFDVASDAKHPFTVETPQGIARVTGTAFNIRGEKNAAVVSLAEGRVELARQAFPSDVVVLPPGQQARLSASGISAPAPFDRTAVTAWMRGQFVFYDTPLAEVVAALNRYRSGRILILDSDLNRLKVSGVFATDDPDAALAVIEDTLPVRATRLTDYLVLLRQAPVPR